MEVHLFLVIVFAVLGALWQKGYLGEWWGQLRNKAEQASHGGRPSARRACARCTGRGSQTRFRIARE